MNAGTLSSSAAGARTDAAKSDDAVPQTAPVDGRLTTTTGDVITDYGDLRQRREAVRALDLLQRDFRAGDMTSACARISDFLLDQFTPPGTREETPCPRRLEAYAVQRAERGERPPRLRLLWVRAYTGEAGVWVEDDRGRRTRIQLSDPPPGDGWRLDLGVIRQPEILAAKLVGADSYGRR